MYNYLDEMKPKTFKLFNRDIEALKKVSKKLDLNQSQIVRRALEDYLWEHDGYYDPDLITVVDERPF